MRTGALVAVGTAMVRSWRHELIRSLGGSALAFRVVVGLLLLVVVAWVVLVSSVRHVLDAAPFEQAQLVGLLVTLTWLVVVSTAAVATVALSLLVPDGDAFAALLHTMPLRPQVRRLALEAPLLAGGTVVAAVTGAPFVWIGAQAVYGGVRAAVVAVAVLGAAVGVLLAAAGVRLLTVGLTLLRVPEAVARSLAAVGVVALLGYQVLARQEALAGGTVARRATSWLAALVERQPLAGVGVALVTALVVALLWYATAGLAPARVGARGVRSAGPFAGVAHPQPRSMTRLALAQLARTPSHVSAVTLVATSTVALVLLPGAREALLWPLGGAALVLAPALLGMAAYGVTWATHWTYRVTTDDPVAWVGPLWRAAGLATLAVSALVALAFLLTPGWDLATAAQLLPQVVVAFTAAMAVGLVLPVTDDQPLSTVGALVLTAGTGAVGAVLVARVGGDRWWVGLLVAGVVLVLVRVAYAPVARWRERDLVV